MPRHRLLRLPLVNDFASAGLQTLFSRYVPAGQVWHIERVTFEGDKATSSGETRARLYITERGQTVYLHEQDGPTAKALYEITEPFTMIEGERLALEWDQGQATTRLKMGIIGSIEFVERP